MGPVFIRKGSPPSNGRMGSPPGTPLGGGWAVSSKSAARPLAETPFWRAAPAGCTPFATGPDAVAPGTPCGRWRSASSRALASASSLWRKDETTKGHECEAAGGRRIYRRIRQPMKDVSQKDEKRPEVSRVESTPTLCAI
ncbi:hypothetical protein EYF80_032450 [Liparis tanakae]|uniref:Uncharacterized protein n=1 Tax=Liparis tanakae TaxID=230148 RepID=A0A4Z2GXQ1_9TELE|nr:hypothetical protein EYF80_032450 [Liparis tanakae]